MKSPLRIIGILAVYLTILFVEGVFSQFTLSPVFTPAGAQKSQSLTVQDVENLSPFAAYGLDGFSDLTISFVSNLEILTSYINISCPGSFTTESVHVDKGIKYILHFTPTNYCPNTSIAIGNTVITEIKWDRWGKRLSYLLDMSSSAIEAQVDAIETQILIEKLDDATRSYYMKMLETLHHILSSREAPGYLVPVPGSHVPTEPSYLPNAGRPYREKYTDGIHHGWDFYGSLGSPVVSLDDGVVVYVKNDFVWDEFENIIYDGEGDHEYTNLDILRGNQVWIKTMTGDVVMYSHLQHVDANVREGDIVTRGQYVGDIGATGVPFRGYDQYHLHMPLMVNPLRSDKIGKYSRLDIMKWNWYGKDKTQSWILENQPGLFVYE